MKWRIWLEKLYLLRRIQNKDEQSLCRKIYEQEKSNNFPGLASEVCQICKEIGISDLNKEYVSIKTIKEAIIAHHDADMKVELSKSKKLENIKDDNFSEPQRYMQGKSVQLGRLSFKIRVQMLENIPANFKSKCKNNSDGLLCKHCTSGDVLSQNNCHVCPAWQELREGLDMKEIKDLTMFFKRVVLERGKDDKVIKD